MTSKKAFGVVGLKTWNTDDGGGYQATITVDGQPVAFIHNDGNGGNIQWDVKDLPRLTAFAASHGITDFMTGNFVNCDSDLDSLVCEAIDDAEHLKRLKRMAKTKTLFRLPDDEEGSWRTLLALGEKAAAQIRQQYPTAVIFDGTVCK